MSTLASPTPATPPAPTLPEENRFEEVDGKRVELPPMSAYASIIASRLWGEVIIWLRTQDLGAAVAEVLFQLPAPINRNRRPDVAFVSYERWPKSRPYPESENAWAVVPDLVAEVVSPTDYAEDILERVEEYLRAGVRLVWVVYPRRRLLHAYQSLTQIRGLTRQNVLDGADVLPGFRLPLEALFA
jgi:Uma2 family endonuclease